MQPKTNNPLVIAGRHDLFGDDINEIAIIEPTKALAAGTRAFDDHVVDGAVMGSATTVTGLAEWLRKGQNGYVRTYGLLIAIGAVVLTAIVFYGTWV